MRIYVAAPWKYREKAAHAAHILHNAGFTILSRWHDEYIETPDLRTYQEQALADLHDVGCAQVLILLNLAYSEGKSVELGYALHAGLTVLLVGSHCTNIFHYHPRVRLVPSLDAAIEVLSPPGVPSHDTDVHYHTARDVGGCRVCDDGDFASPPLGGAPLLEQSECLHRVEPAVDGVVGDGGALPPLTRHGL